MTYFLLRQHKDIGKWKQTFYYRNLVEQKLRGAIIVLAIKFYFALAIAEFVNPPNVMTHDVLTEN